MSKFKTALNPKAAWPFPQDRKELEAERDQFRERVKELVAALHEVIALVHDHADNPGGGSAWIIINKLEGAPEFCRAHAILAKERQ